MKLQRKKYLSVVIIGVVSNNLADNFCICFVKRTAYKNILLRINILDARIRTTLCSCFLDHLT